MFARPVDEDEQRRNISTKVTLPVGLIVGVIGILAASWLIWCVLSGCYDSNSSSSKTSSSTYKRSDSAFSSFVDNPAKGIRNPGAVKQNNSPGIFDQLIIDANAVQKSSTPFSIDSTNPHRLLQVSRAKAELADVGKIIESFAAVQDSVRIPPTGATNPKKWPTVKAEGYIRGGGKKNKLPSVPLIVIIILLLVVHGKMTERRR